MSVSPLFSAYRGGENRVTSSLIAVLERIEVHLVERILSAAIREANVSLLSFTNQVVADASGASTVPDASLSANLNWLFEVKLVRNALLKGQLQGHLEHLDGKHSDERLIVITPDPVEPPVIAELDDRRVHWTNFAGLSDAIDSVLGDPGELVGERTVFLLRELQSLFRAEGLLEFDDVVVVAARVAYPEYRQSGAYICQPGRSFQPDLTHVGFYADGEIKPELPRILGTRDLVVFSEDEADRLSGTGDAIDARVAEVIRWALADSARGQDQPYMVILLSPVDGPETVRLSGPVRNNTVAASGRPWAWTLGQRYTRLSALQKNPRTTDELATAVAALAR